MSWCVISIRVVSYHALARRVMSWHVYSRTYCHASIRLVSCHVMFAGVVMSCHVALCRAVSPAPPSQPARRERATADSPAIVALVLRWCYGVLLASRRWLCLGGDDGTMPYLIPSFFFIFLLFLFRSLHSRLPCFLSSLISYSALFYCLPFPFFFSLWRLDGKRGK